MTHASTGRRRQEDRRVVHNGLEGFEMPVAGIESTRSLTYITLGADLEITLVEQGVNTSGRAT